MADTNTETIADIIAEKRRLADKVERDSAEKMKHGEMVSDCYARELVADIRREADRLEAAHKRELTTLNLGVSSAHDALREVIEQNRSHCHKRELAAGGNMAAMREALSDACYAMFNFLKSQTGGYEEMANALDKAKAALAATAEKSSEIKLTREEERAIDKKLGPNFKKDMNEFAEKLQDLMVEFPMAQGHSKEARYLQQPFSMMSGALHLTKRFCMTERERDEDDDIIASIPIVLDALAGVFGGSGIQEMKGDAK